MKPNILDSWNDQWPLVRSSSTRRVRGRLRGVRVRWSCVKPSATSAEDSTGWLRISVRGSPSTAGSR